MVRYNQLVDGFPHKEADGGSIPPRTSKNNAFVAQLEEHLPDTQEAVGSRPTKCTKDTPSCSTFTIGAGERAEVKAALRDTRQTLMMFTAPTCPGSSAVRAGVLYTQGRQFKSAPGYQNNLTLLQTES